MNYRLFTIHKSVEKSLDEDILQQQIEAKNTTISTYESILYSLYNLKDVNPIYISNVRGVISNATSKRDELQRKLEKLQSFASSTSGHFSDSESLQTLVFKVSNKSQVTLRASEGHPQTFWKKR